MLFVSPIFLFRGRRLRPWSTVGLRGSWSATFQVATQYVGKEATLFVWILFDVGQEQTTCMWMLVAWMFEEQQGLDYPWCKWCTRPDPIKAKNRQRVSTCQWDWLLL